MKIRTVFLGAVASSALAHAATVSAPSTQWTTIAGNYDYLADQQTGQPAGDIVGNTNNPGFFTTFNDNGSASHTDGTLGFRVRLDDAGGNKNSPAFDRVLWVGIDANLNGSIDAFVGVNFQGSNSSIGIYDAGTGLNTSPSTTTVANNAAFTYAASGSNYDYRAVVVATDGGTTNDITTSTSGDPDYYVSFMVPFQDVVSFLNTQGYSITDQTALRYVLATSTQPNSLNQDLGAVNGGVNSTTSWTDLGGFSPTMNAAGSALSVPETSSAWIGALGAVLLVRRRG